MGSRPVNEFLEDQHYSQNEIEDMEDINKNKNKRIECRSEDERTSKGRRRWKVEDKVAGKKHHRSNTVTDEQRLRKEKKVSV